MLKRVLTSRLDEGLRLLLVDVIKAYFPVPESERERYQRLLSRKEYKVVQDTELTWSDELILKGKREALKHLIATKFGPPSADVEAQVDAVASAEQLDSYLERVLTASSLLEMGLG